MAGTGIAVKGVGKVLKKLSKKKKGSVEGWRENLRQRSQLFKEGQERLKKAVSKEELKIWKSK